MRLSGSSLVGSLQHRQDAQAARLVVALEDHEAADTVDDGPMSDASATESGVYNEFHLSSFRGIMEPLRPDSLKRFRKGQGAWGDWRLPKPFFFSSEQVSPKVDFLHEVPPVFEFVHVRHLRFIHRGSVVLFDLLSNNVERGRSELRDSVALHDGPCRNVLADVLVLLEVGTVADLAAVCYPVIGMEETRLADSDHVYRRVCVWPKRIAV